MTDRYGSSFAEDFTGVLTDGDPIIVKLTVPDDDGIERTTRWSFPTHFAADLFTDVISADPYLKTHEHTIERESADAVDPD